MAPSARVKVINVAKRLLVQPSRRMDFEALESARVGIDACKLNVLAEIVPPIHA